MFIEIPIEDEKLDYIANKSPFYPIRFKTKLLDRLTKKQREVVILKLGGKGFREIGEILKITKQSAWERYKSGLRRLGY